MQCVPRSSRPKKKTARIISQPAIEEVSEEAAVEELTGKEVTPEEAISVVDAPPKTLHRKRCRSRMHRPAWRSSHG